MGYRLSDYLPDPNTVQGSLAEVVEIMQKEAPLLVNEILVWGVASHLVTQIMCVILFVVVLKLYKSKIKAWMAIDDMWKEERCIFGVLGSLFYVLALSITFFISFGWIKPLFMPRLYMMEYIANMVG